jgi:predicted transposase YbfD/YdcC
VNDDTFKYIWGTMNHKKPKEFYSDIDQLVDSQNFMESVREGFKEVEDPREDDNQIYPLVSLLVMIICAILAGANTISDIYAYARIKIEMFKRLLGLERAPSYGIFWWLLTRLNPKNIENCFVRWIQALPEEEKEKLIAIDGKHLNGVARNQKIHLVSAWDSNRSLLLGQVKAKEKSNEITAIPDLLDSLDLEDATVTIDAAGCQKNIVEKIREGGGNYFIALKGNQEVLRSEAENFFTQARAVGYDGADCKGISNCEKGHGRIEEREVVVTSELDWLECKKEWKDLTSLVEVTSRRTIKGETTEARRFYISNQVLTPEVAGKNARSHWSVENHLHWNMDVNFAEDASLAGIGHAPENLAILKRLASTLIRIDLGGIRGTAERRRQAAWDDSWTIRLLSRIFTIEM